MARHLGALAQGIALLFWLSASAAAQGAASPVFTIDACGFKLDDSTKAARNLQTNPRGRRIAPVTPEQKAVSGANADCEARDPATPLWASKEEKAREKAGEKAPDQAPPPDPSTPAPRTVTFVNGGSPVHVSFRVDPPTDPRERKKAESKWIAFAPGFRFAPCPGVVGTCGIFPLAANARVTIPGLMLDRISSTPEAEFNAAFEDGSAPVYWTARVGLEPAERQNAGTRRVIATRTFEGGKVGPVVALDNTGIADWDYLNPRKVPQVDGYDVFGFENRTADRVFVVAVPVNAASSTRGARQKAADEGLTLVPCKHVDGTCAILTLTPGTSEAIAVDMIKDPERPVVKFSVSFFNENATPAYTIGYARTSDAVVETQSRAPIGLVARITGSTEPSLKDDNGNDLRISAESPLDGNRRLSTMSAQARVTLKPNLGDRASADIDLLFAQNTLGGKDARVAAGLKTDLNPVSVSKYVVNVFGQNGIQLSFGKTTFLESALLSESGEGVRLNWRNLGVTRILKRESANLDPTRENNDHDVWIAQANNLLSGLEASPLLRAINATLIYGKDRKPDADARRKYWTVGGEAVLAMPTLHLQGSAGVYHSRREPHQATLKNRDGDGWMGYMTATWSHLSKPTGAAPPKLLRSVGFTYAQGTGDKADTAKDEGFMGESASYAPDVLFLSSLASRFGPAPAADTGIASVRSGLSNKTYFQVSFTDETFSPLELVTTLLQLQSDVVSRRTTVRYHRYRFDEAVLEGRHPGDELQLEFSIETPRGVRSSVTIGHFMSASPYDAYFKHEPWKVVAFLQVAM